MSTREGRGYVEGLGEFRPAPHMMGENPWREIRNILAGLGDDFGRSGPDILIQKLQAVALSAAWEAVFKMVGFRWSEMSDQQWFDKALEQVGKIREIYYRGSPKNIDEYIQQSKDYQQVYATLAVLLLVWADAVKFREYQKEVAMKRQ